MNDSAKQRVESFLSSTSVPFSGSPQWNEWQEQCNRLVGAGGWRVLVDVLKTGPESLNYGAMVALKMLGVQVGQTGEGSETIYEVHTSDGSVKERFHPIHPPDPPRTIEDIEDDPDWSTRFEKNP